MKGKSNWKRAFFILLGSVLIICTVLIGLVVYSILSKPELEADFAETGKGTKPFFTLSTSKSAINSWIKEELDKKEKTVKNINYEVYLDDYIYLKGGLLVFNREIPFQMVFHPHVNEEGGLTLQEREISLGKLQLPGEIVLSLIHEQIDFPEWVKVEPTQQEIIVDVKNIELEKGMELSIKRFDLKQDQLEFNLTR
ncbi:YpmS family protein [Bacillus sp. DJP31]|uniref:YpmS family protein n=1 Tax=Bacillus sp. DJP31 TaxID=3409789 RepID=UPI003BB73033